MNLITLKCISTRVKMCLITLKASFYTCQNEYKNHKKKYFYTCKMSLNTLKCIFAREIRVYICFKMYFTIVKMYFTSVKMYFTSEK